MLLLRCTPEPHPLACMSDQISKMAPHAAHTMVVAEAYTGVVNSGLVERRFDPATRIALGARWVLTSNVRVGSTVAIPGCMVECGDVVSRAGPFRAFERGEIGTVRQVAVS